MTISLRLAFILTAVTTIDILSGSHLHAAVTFTSLHNFSGNDGGSLQAGLTQFGQSLYGTTHIGGVNNSGTLFELNRASNVVTTLHSFSQPTDGFLTSNQLTSIGSQLYGSAFYGGTSNNGTLFKFDTVDGSLTALHSFPLATGNGTHPASHLVLVGNTLYGTTQEPIGGGTIFGLSISDSTVVNLHNFSAGEGSTPFGTLARLGSSSLYGTTYNGGANGVGTIYRFDTVSNLLTTLHSFAGAASARPLGNLIATGSILYGTTQGNNGTIFSFDTVTNALTTLHVFSGLDGSNPSGSLVVADSKLYGTTAAGGASASGTIYSFDLDNNKLTTLHSFSGNDGATPYGGLTLVGSTLYGTTYTGGSGLGTLFSLKIPEPTSLWLLVLGALLLPGSRRVHRRL